jgi:hypothetical protein
VASLPIVSYLGPALAGVMAGSFVIETVFGLPGIGTNFVRGAEQRDYTLVMGVVILYASMIIFFNMLADVLYGVLARAEAVANIAIGSVPYLLGAGVAQLGFLVGRSIKVVTDTIGALGSLNFEGAWNAAIDGLLGPTGIPGAILNLTIGAGQQIAVIPPGQGPNQDAPFSNFIPSTRTLLQSAANQIAGIVPPAFPNKGLATPNPLSPPTASVRKAARSAASVAAPAVAAPAGDSSAAADSSAPAEKPATHRASRKAVRAAS